MQKMDERVAEKNKKSDNRAKNKLQVLDYQVFINEKYFYFQIKLTSAES